MRSCFEFIKKGTKRALVGAEIGVRRGKNAQDILDNMNIKKLYLVDPWRGHEARYYEGVCARFTDDERVQILKVTSKTAGRKIEEPLDFVYIDADHSYKSVFHDLRIWARKVKPGGYVCGHDYTTEWPGVEQAVWKFCAERGIRYTVEADGRLSRHKGRAIFSCNWWFQKEKTT